MLLGSSRFLNAEIDRSDNEPAQAELKVLSVEPRSQQVRLSIHATDNNGLRAYAVIDNHAQYAVTAGPIQGTLFSGEEVVKIKTEGGASKLTLIVVDQGGNQTRVSHN